MRIVIDRDKGRVLEATVNGETYRLVGECNQCGACCEMNRADCKYLTSEVQDGRPVKVCSIYWSRPWYCAYYPFDPLSETDPPVGCGFTWERTK